MAQNAPSGSEITTSETPFVSVKLPAALVNQARDAAQTMRRSVASQIEYWATLGKALEHAGLTTGDSQALIARQESARYVVGEHAPLSTELEALHAHVLAVAKSGSLRAHPQGGGHQPGQGSQARQVT
jgi:hypothetical protein